MLHERKSVDKYETKLNACHLINDIQTASEKDLGLKKNAFIESVQQPIVKVCDQFNRLQLKEEKMQGLATTPKLSSWRSSSCMPSKLTALLAQTDSTKVKLSKIKTDLKSFTSKHCQIRHYSFQIKKCMDETCTYCLEKQMLIEVFSSLPWIPDPVPKDDISEKYLPYEEVVGTETTDKHRQSFGTGGNQIDSDRKDLLVSTRLFLIFVSVFISCIFVSLQLTVSM